MPVEYKEIQRNMPVRFENYQNTMIVLEMPEMSPQIIFAVQKQFHFPIHDKCFTGWTLIFVSKSYGGRAFDEVIFQQKNIVNTLCRARESIVVNKGFLIDEMCDSHEIKVIRPPFLRNKKQFAREKAELNRGIAAARVHVKRMHQRIRLFNILNNTSEWNLHVYVENIFIVCCGFANVGSPILSDDKFL